MLVSDPVYEPWEVIEKKYYGYCILLAKCINKTVRPKGGEVWAYNESLAELIGEVDHLIETDDYNFGINRFINLTGFADAGVIQVVASDN